MSALSQNLKESLTIFSKSASDISINIMKMEKIGLSPSYVISSLIMICVGFTTYYLAPLSYFSKNYKLFSSIMNIILILMIIGMIFMLQLIAPYLERFFLNIILLIAYKDRNLKFMIYKNLEGHRKRNKKTSIMFMIALSFVIFAGCCIELISNFISSGSKNVYGGNIQLWQNDGKDSLNEIEISSYLKQYNEKNGINLIKNFTFVSYPMDEIIGSKLSLASVGGYSVAQYTSLMAVDENLLQSIFIDFYSYTELNKDIIFKDLSNNKDGWSSNKDIVKALFSNIGYKGKSHSDYDFDYKDIDSQDKTFYSNYTVSPQVPILKSNELKYGNILLIAAEGIRNSFSLSTKKPAKIIINKRPYKSYQASVIAMANKIAGFIQFSSYSYLANDAAVLTSSKQFKDILEIESMYDPLLKERLLSQEAKNKAFDNLRKKYCYIKFNDDQDIIYSKENNSELLSKNKLLELKNQVIISLKTLINTDNTKLTYTDSLIEMARESSDLLDYLVLVIGIIALILSFFLILISFYSNIRDSVTELGIARAIGVDKQQTIRMFLYEALVLILSSIVIGTFIGLVINIRV